MNIANLARGGYPGRVVVTAGSETETGAGPFMDPRIMTPYLASIHDLKIDRSTPQTCSAFSSYP